MNKTNNILPRFGTVFVSELDPFIIRRNEKPEALVREFADKFCEAADWMETSRGNAKAMNDVEVLASRNDVYVLTGEEARQFKRYINVYGDYFENRLMQDLSPEEQEMFFGDDRQAAVCYQTLINECLKSAVADFVRTCVEAGSPVQRLPVTLLDPMNPN